MLSEEGIDREAGLEPSNNDDASDADSDLEELQGDIARFDESVRTFLASQRENAGPSRAMRGGPRGRGARGPRKAAKPRGDITARLSKVNQAFLAGDYPQALDLAFEVIRINAETHQAWTAVASTFREQGELNRALSAMVYAAHLRPKDVDGWIRCALFALDTIEDDEAGNLHTARLCYSAAIRTDPTKLEARLGKASVCHRQGHLASAISEYSFVLKHRPQDLELVRKLAEACVDNKQAETAVPAAIAAYRRYFDHEIASQDPLALDFLWHDVGIYVELFAATGRYSEAVRELKTLSRWLVGRAFESYWDEWQDDDREWDDGFDRRLEVPEFAAGSSSHPGLYGRSLPQDLRVRLAIYRLRLGDESEALEHASWLDPADQHTKDFANDFPFLVFDLAGELAQCDRALLGIQYLEILRSQPGDPDATLLLQLGRCYLAAGEQPAAEECFLAAIDADEETIDARIELANMYEGAKEDEEALILAAEAMALREARDPESGADEADARPEGASPPRRGRRRRSSITARQSTRRRRLAEGAGPAGTEGRHMVRRRYRPKRLAGPDRQRQDEEARAVKLSRQFEVVRNLKQQISAGQQDLVPSWLASSGELFDDFRSLKKFYTWEKYLLFLNPKRNLEQHPHDGQPHNELSQMYERLTRSVAPQIEQSAGDRQPALLDTHRGISFESWLDLFLDYAIGLAMAHRRDEAYEVCQAARDSTVFQSSEHDFFIHIAWGACAIYANDEQKCVAVARHLMKDATVSDAYRMFALLSCLCQSPISWYTSGPAQKYILRQIKALDAGHENDGPRGSGVRRGATGGDEVDTRLDVCLLMLYGHILFTSTSYTYALSYFLRARALDEANAMVNLSLGLSYVHYGMKRQSTNRQYLLLQGHAFMNRYAELCHEGPEGYYNVGRLFHLLGINSAAWEYYERALQHCEQGRDDDIRTSTLANRAIMLLSTKNKAGAMMAIKRGIVL